MFASRNRCWKSTALQHTYVHPACPMSSLWAHTRIPLRSISFRRARLPSWRATLSSRVASRWKSSGTGSDRSGTFLGRRAMTSTRYVHRIAPGCIASQLSLADECPQSATRVPSPDIARRARDDSNKAQRRLAGICLPSSLLGWELAEKDVETSEM